MFYMQERGRRMRRGKRGVVEGTLEKERRLVAGSWLAGVVEAGANEPFFTPVGRWVVERGLPRLLSVSRISGLRRPFFLLPFVRSLSSFRLSRFRSYVFSLVLPSLTSVLFRARLSQPFYFDLVSAAVFPFFPPSDLYVLPSLLLPPLPTSPLFRRPLRARFSGFSCAPFRPPAYPLRNRSTETCSGVAGTNENVTKGNGVAYEIRAI